MMNFTRRDFLTFAGFTVLGVAGGSYLKNQLMPRESYYLGNDFRSRHEEIHSGICGMCPAGCGIHVRLVDGLPVKIDGNPDCPISRGKLCPKGQMGLELHYNPDRIASPLKRSGPPGSEQWERLSWDEALALFRAKVGPALLDHTGKGVAVVSHEEHSISSHLWAEFNAKHSDRSRLVSLNLLRDRAILSALKLTIGSPTDWPLYDIENADLLLVFDTPVVSGWSNPTLMIGKYGSFRRGRERTRGKMIYVGSRRSMDAANADLSVLISPYTSAVLAYGLAHVIIRESRYDEKFVARYCTGFKELKTLILKYFRPKTVSDITGVSIETINSVARMFAGNERPIAIGERIPEASQTWEQSAYLMLNALKGSVGVKGGIQFQERLEIGGIQPGLDDTVDLKDLDQSPLQRLVTDIEEHGIIPDVLLVDKVNPATTVLPGNSWTDVLEHVPYVVSFSPYPDLTTSYADLVLPDLGFLEKASDFVHAPSLGYPSVVATDAPAAPAGKGLDTRIVQSLLLDDEYLTGDIIDKRRAEKKLEEKRTEIHHSLFKARRGLIYDTPFTREWVRRMEAGGWWSSDIDSYEDFDKKLKLKGGWADPFVKSGNRDNSLLGDSLKFNMRNIARSVPVADILAGKLSPSPPDIGKEPWITMTVVPTTILSLSSLPYGNIPHLLEFPEPGIITGWEPWLEIHSTTALLLKLSDGDAVRIETDKQERRCRIVVNNGVHPSVGAVPFSMFGMGYGSWINDNMKMPLESLVKTTDSTVGQHGLVIRIRKV